MDLSQSDVAEVLGVTPITVSRWETGTQAPDDLTKRMIRVPIYEDAYAACAGNGNHNEGAEPAVMEYRLFDISEVGPISVDPDKQPFGIKVDGESMEEANIPDGSIAVDTVECGYTEGVEKAKTPDFSGVCKTFRHLPV